MARFLSQTLFICGCFWSRIKGEEDPHTTEETSWQDIFSSTDAGTTTTEASVFLNYTFKENCSAINSFVAIVNPTSMRDTLLSEQALFTPYTYHLESTQLILLDDEDNNACFNLSININNSDIELVTDVSNKAVLIWRGGGGCSDESKIYILEENGALGVLIANNKDVTVVETIEIDYEFEEMYDYSPSIPVRMISEEDGWYLENYITSLGVTVIEDNSDGNSGTDDSMSSSSSYDNDTLLIEMSCLNNDYPSIICIVDGTGDLYYIDGDYEQEASEIESYNDHPVYKKEGYFGLSSDLYMYLQDSSESDLDYSDTSSDHWHWVISFDFGSTDDNDIVGFCNASSVDPGQCKTWQMWDTSSSSNSPVYQVNSKIWVNDTVCDISESYVCLDSGNYQLSGLSGTYKLLTSAEPLWYRELTEEDMTPGYFFFTNYYKPNFYFFLIDSVDSNIQAYCTWTGSANKKTRFSPELCDTWSVVPDSTTDDDTYYVDDKFSITNTTCPANNDTSTDDDEDDDGSHLCLGGMSLNHGLLEGEYELVDNMTTSSGRSVWYSTHLSDDEDYDAYIYYLGDIDSDYLWWVIGSNSPDSNSLSIYGYCAAMVDHPSDCQGCWFFYFDDNANDNLNGDYDPDCDLYVDRGECPLVTTTTSEGGVSLPTYLCLTFDDSTTYSGTYMISSELYADDDDSDEDYYIDGKYYWTQIVNSRGDEKDSDDSYYLTYDSTFGFWLFSDSLDGFEDAIYKCTDYDGNNPYYCTEWRDLSSNSNIDLIIEEKNCNISVNTPPTQPPTENKETTTNSPTYTDAGTGVSTTGNGSLVGYNQPAKISTSEDATYKIIGIVGGIAVFLICCFVCCGYRWFRHKRYPGQAGFGAPMPDDDDIELHRRTSKHVLMDHDEVGVLGSTGDTGGGGTLGNNDDDGELTIDKNENESDDSDPDEQEDDGNNITNINESDNDIVVPEMGNTKGGDDENDKADDYDDGWTKF